MLKKNGKFSVFFQHILRIFTIVNWFCIKQRALIPGGGGGGAFEKGGGKCWYWEWSGVFREDEDEDAQNQ